jgi:hypothetical protein
VTGGRLDPPDPEDAWGVGAGPPPGDVLEGGTQPPWWQSRWRAVRPAVRRCVVALVALLLVAAAGLWLRDRAAERALAQRVDIGVSLGVWSSSTAPLGGRVCYFAVVRNEGTRPVWVTSVDGSSGGLRLATRDDEEWPVAAGDEVRVPLSVRLTCTGPGPGDDLTARIAVRREDGGAVVRRLRPEPAVLLLGVAESLCSVRPELTDRELSGPVLDGRADRGGGPGRRRSDPRAGGAVPGGGHAAEAVR